MHLIQVFSAEQIVAVAKGYHQSELNMLGRGRGDISLPKFIKGTTAISNATSLGTKKTLGHLP